MGLLVNLKNYKGTFGSLQQSPKEGRLLAVIKLSNGGWLGVNLKCYLEALRLKAFCRDCLIFHVFKISCVIV